MCYNTSKALQSLRKHYVHCNTFGHYGPHNVLQQEFPVFQQVMRKSHVEKAVAMRVVLEADYLIYLWSDLDKQGDTTFIHCFSPCIYKGGMPHNLLFFL